MPVFDVYIRRTTTYRVHAESLDDAVDAALCGDGTEIDQTTLGAEADGPLEPEPDVPMNAMIAAGRRRKADVTVGCHDWTCDECYEEARS